MDELLQKLFAAEVLTEDTKAELETAFKKQLEEAITSARAEATANVTAELNEQWIAEREVLIEALDSKVTEALTYELHELQQDIERFRDIEAEYAEKLVEAKAEMADILKGDMAQLIEHLDAFLEVRLSSELEELREDFEVVKKNQWGSKIFEAFVEEFKIRHVDEDSTASKLHEAEQRLEDALTALEDIEKKSARLERSIKMEKVLSPLSGRTREVMEAILKNVDTPLLEDAYKTYIGRVLKETTDKTSEKETPVLAEGKTDKVRGVAKDGNDKQRITEEADQATKDADLQVKQTISEAEKYRLRKLAGVI